MADAHPNVENVALPDVREEGRWPVVFDAEAAYEAIRSINHRTNERWLDSSARP